MVVVMVEMVQLIEHLYMHAQANVDHLAGPAERSHSLLSRAWTVRCERQVAPRGHVTQEEYNRQLSYTQIH